MNTDGHGSTTVWRKATDVEVIIGGTTLCDLSVEIRVNPWLAIQNHPRLMSSTEGNDFSATDEHGRSRICDCLADGHRR
jgi:hypothetical protein